VCGEASVVPGSGETVIALWAAWEIAADPVGSAALVWM
jgi:hypothetical protein